MGACPDRPGRSLQKAAVADTSTETARPDSCKNHGGQSDTGAGLSHLCFGFPTPTITSNLLLHLPPSPTQRHAIAPTLSHPFLEVGGLVFLPTLVTVCRVRAEVMTPRSTWLIMIDVPFVRRSPPRVQSRHHICNEP